MLNAISRNRSSSIPNMPLRGTNWAAHISSRKNWTKPITLTSKRSRSTPSSSAPTVNSQRWRPFSRSGPKSRKRSPENDREMKLGLEGKVVVITGGSKGIGLACARAFAREGARVSIASRSEANLNQARQNLANEGFEVVTVRADFARMKDAETAVKQTEKLLGPTDVLVNSAGAAQRFFWEKLDEEAWQQGMNAKYFPYIHAMDAVRPGMIERKRGSIVNIIGMGGKAAAT